MDYTNKEWLEEQLKTKTMKTIAEEIGTTKGTISRWANKLGVEQPNKTVIVPLNENYKDPVWLEEKLKTYKLDDIGEMCGVSKQQISRWAKKLGLNVKYKTPERTSDEKYADPKWLSEQVKTKTFTQIANECGVTQGLISRYAKRFGISASYNKIEENVKSVFDDKETLCKLYNTMSIEEIIDTYGVSKTFYYSKLKEHEIEYTKTQIDLDVKEKLEDFDWLNEQYKNKSSEVIADELGINGKTVCLALKSHGIEFTYSERETKGSVDITKILDEMGVEYKINVRDLIHPKEIDIYIPSHKLGIEFNGTYWHSDIHKHKNYHQDKTLAALEQGVRLIHVWEHDWNDEGKKNIIINRIKHHVLGGDKVYARKCVVESIPNKKAKSFHEVNHIQGGKYSANNLGLFFDGDLVAVLSLSKTKNLDDEYEIDRYSTSCNVVGGFSKLLKHFTSNTEWKAIHTFASLDYGTGNMYKMCGFAMTGITKPNYVYHRRGVTLSRQQCMKGKLSKLLEVYDESLSEYQNMVANKYMRIFDSGSMKYEMRNE